MAEHLKIKVGVDKASLQTSTSSISSSFKKLGATIAGAFTLRAFADFAKSSIALASDVEEVQNVVDVSFGEMRDQMEAFADTALETYGISKLAAKRTGSTYMAMAKGMGIAGETASSMALGLTALSADMASFFNTTQEYTDIALKSVFTGETETLKQYGIVMTQTNLKEFARQKGITKSIQAMTQQEQTMLRYKYVMAQTQLVQGDYARTADSWANSSRRLAESWKEVQIEFGETFKALATKVLPYINSALQILSQFAQALRKSMTAIGVITEEEANATEQVASNTASAISNQEDLTAATEETAEAAKGSVAGFDEVNQITEESADTATDTAGTLGEGLGVSEQSTPTGEAEAGISKTVAMIMEIIGGALIVIGVLLCTFGHIGWGIAFIIAGATLFVSGQAALNDFDTNSIQSMFDNIIGICSLALVALGIILLKFGGPAAMAPAIALIAGGAVIFVANAVLQNETISEEVRTLISVIMAIVGTGLLVLGVILLFNPATIGMGLALIAVGAISLVTVISANKDAIVGWVKDVWKAIKNFWNKYIAVVFTSKFWKDLFSKIGDGIKSGAKAAINGLIWLANKAIDGLNLILKPLRSVIFGVMKVFGSKVSFDDVKIPHIPKLAKGAVLPANKPFLAQLGDQKNGRNLEAPESLLREVYAESQQPIVQLLQELVEVEKKGRTLVANGRELAKTVNSANKQMGKNIFVRGV